MIEISVNDVVQGIVIGLLLFLIEKVYQLNKRLARVEGMLKVVLDGSLPSKPDHNT